MKAGRFAAAFALTSVVAAACGRRVVADVSTARDVTTRSASSCCWISSSVSASAEESGISFKVVSILKLTLGVPIPRSARVMRLLVIRSSRSFQGFVADALVVAGAGAGVAALVAVEPPALMNERNVCPMVIVMPVVVADAISFRCHRPAAVNST